MSAALTPEQPAANAALTPEQPAANAALIPKQPATSAALTPEQPATSAALTPEQPATSAAAGSGRPAPSWRQPRTDRDSAEWWAAVARHELLLQRCAGCGDLRWPPRAMCARCGGFDWTWRPSAGNGTVASWIRSHRPFAPGVPLPNVTVLVRLADQPDLLLPGGWTGTGEPRTGSAVRLCFDDIEPGLTLLSWEAAP